MSSRFHNFNYDSLMHKTRPLLQIWIASMLRWETASVDVSFWFLSNGKLSRFSFADKLQNLLVPSI